QTKPREVWFDLRPDKTNERAQVRWSAVPGYPVAAWGMDARDWPNGTGGKGPAQPVLKAWWHPTEEAPAATTIECGPGSGELVNLLGISKRQVTVEGDPVVIDSVAIETHPVEIAPGKFEQKSCLVVRVSHALGRPVYVRLRGLNITGTEHRFYQDAGK